MAHSTSKNFKGWGKYPAKVAAICVGFLLISVTGPVYDSEAVGSEAKNTEISTANSLSEVGKAFSISEASAKKKGKKKKRRSPAPILAPSPAAPSSDTSSTATTDTTSETTSETNLFAGKTIYVEPNNRARQTADQWYQEGRTADAQQMEEVAKTGTSRWIPGSDPSNVTNNYVSAATSAGQLPIVVLYNIPARDCGSYSSGGSGSAGAYRTYVDSISTAIGARKAAVVIEPDALAQLTKCLDEVGQQERLDLLKYAVDKFKANNPSVATYLDAGNPPWKPASTMIDRLKRAGVANARGFSLNISNFVTTAENISYGKEISAGVGDKQFIIDTARNGNGVYSGPSPHTGDCPSWANPPGRALGERAGYVKPTEALVDSYVWIKPPGESDANCGGYPRAGGWVSEYALGLAKNASWSV